MSGRQIGTHSRSGSAGSTPALVWHPTARHDCSNLTAAFGRHHERNHQGLHDRLIAPAPTGPPDGAIRCRPRLGGLLRYYYRAAWCLGGILG